MPPQIYANEGKVQLQNDVLTSDVREAWTLKLYKVDREPTEADTAASYTECDFDGYAPKTLTRSRSGTTWKTPAATTPSGSPAWTEDPTVSRAEYGDAPQVFTCTGSTGNTIYGYYIVGATSNKLICAERFGTPRAVSNGDTLSITPGFDIAGVASSGS